MKRMIGLLFLSLFLAGGPFLFASSEATMPPAQAMISLAPSPVMALLLAMGGVGMFVLRNRK